MPTPPTATWVQGAMTRLLAQNDAFFGRMAQRPQFFWGTAAAMAAAPLFLKNDERGYVDTALITTPLIAAASMVGPTVFQAVRAEGRRLNEVFQQVPTTYGFRKGPFDVTGGQVWNVAAERAAFERGDVSLAQHLRLWSQQHAPTSRVPHIASDQRSVAGLFGTLWRDASKRRLVQNALFRSELDVISSADLVGRELSAVAPGYSAADYGRQFLKYRNNPDWLHGMHFRLQQASRVVDPGAAVALKATSALRPVTYEFDPGFKGVADLYLKQFMPEEYKELEAVMTDPARWKATGIQRVELVAIPGRNKSVNAMEDLLAVRMHYSDVADDFEELLLGNRGGTEYRNRMIVRGGFWSETEDLNPRRYLLRNLPEGRTFLRKERDKAFFWAERDALKSFGQLDNEIESIAVGDRLQAKYGSQRLPSNARDAFLSEHGTTVGWDQLDPNRQVKAVTTHVSSGRFTKLNGSHDAGVVELASARFLEPHGMVNPLKESLERKSITSVELAGVDPARKGFFRTDYLERKTAALSKGVGKPTPTVGVVTAQLSSSQYGLFADLPEWAQVEALAQKSGISRVKALDELVQNTRVIQHIMDDHRVSPERAREIWQRFAPTLVRTENRYDAARRFGYLGEGSRLLSSDAAGAGAYVREISHYDVDQGALGAQGTFNRDTVIGYKKGNPVFADGDTNRILGVTTNANGSVTYEVEKIYGEGLGGMKAQGLVKEGVVPNFGNRELARGRKVLNAYHKAAGSGVRLSSDIQGFARLELHSEKAVNPTKVIEEQAGNLFRRLEDTGELAVVKTHRADLERVGRLTYANRELVYRTAGAKGGETEMMSTVRRIQMMFRDVSADLMNAKIQGDEMMQNATAWMRANGKWRQVNGAWENISSDRLSGGLFDFMTHHALAESVSAADHMNRHVASRVKVTWDALQDLQLSNELEWSAEWTGRLRTDGDTALTRAFAEYVHAGDFSKPLGPEIDVSEALGGKRVQLHSEVGRAGTIFDPGDVRTQGNYSIKMADGSYVPVLGRTAYGGQANRYNAGEISKNAWEGSLLELLEGREGVTRETYLGDVVSNYVLGKKSFLRAERFDAQAGAGKVALRRSTRRFEQMGGVFETGDASPIRIGDVNPNEIGIGDSYRHLFDKDTWRRMKAGEATEGFLVRHPIEGVQPVMIKYDRQFNKTKAVGLDPVLAARIGADGDGDLVSFHLAHGDQVKQRIRTLVDSPDSYVQEMHDWMRRFGRSAGLDPAATGATAPEGLFKRIGKVWREEMPLAKALRGRSGAGATGMLSNTQSQLETLLAHSSTIRGAGRRQVMGHVLFELVRQSPISAAKMQSATEYDLARLMGWNNELMGSLRNRTAGGAETFYQAALTGARDIKHSSAYTDFVTQHKDWFEDVWQSYDRSRDDLVQMITTAAEKTELRTAHGTRLTALVDEFLPGLRRSSGAGQLSAEAALGADNAWRAAARVKTAAGGVADQTLQSVRKVAGAATGHGASRTLLIGAGIAAGAGLLFGSLHSPREGQALAPSGNRHRPEERIGGDGRIPGEPEAGAMAPGNPPRTMGPSARGVRTAVVAPMHTAANLEVRMRTDDPGRAQELSKHLAQMSSSGDAQVTVNYRDAHRTNSLRSQERIRETLERD